MENISNPEVGQTDAPIDIPSVLKKATAIFGSISLAHDQSVNDLQENDLTALKAALVFLHDISDHYIRIIAEAENEEIFDNLEEDDLFLNFFQTAVNNFARIQNLSWKSANSDDQLELFFIHTLVVGRLLVLSPRLIQGTDIAACHYSNFNEMLGRIDAAAEICFSVFDSEARPIGCLLDSALLAEHINLLSYCYFDHIYSHGLPEYNEGSESNWVTTARPAATNGKIYLQQFIPQQTCN